MAWARVTGIGGVSFSICRATARSHSSQSDQSWKPVCIALPISRLRKPEQSMKKSASMVRPSLRISFSTKPFGCRATS
jgi:hypothetical protein